MSHKHPVLGVEVADINEIFTPEDMEEIFTAMGEDEERERMEISRNWQKPIRNFIEMAKDDDPAYLDCLPASVNALRDVRVSEGIGSWGFSITYIAIDGRKYRYFQEHTSGSWSEPPDDYEDIEEVI